LHVVPAAQFAGELQLHPRGRVLPVQPVEVCVHVPACAAAGAVSEAITGRAINDAIPTLLIASRRDTPANRSGVTGS
jgi:hypothetical protein